jgi:hypothetical protein
MSSDTFKSKQLELQLIEFSNPNNSNEYLDIPLDITEIISICKEYSKLDYSLQQQVEYILDYGVAESIKAKMVKKENLPQIKSFLRKICEIPFFGDASDQSRECIELITIFEFTEKNCNLNLN